MQKRIWQLVRDDEGQDLIEYAFLASAIALGAFAGAKLLGVAVNNWYAQSAGTASQGAAAAKAISF